MAEWEIILDDVIVGPDDKSLKLIIDGKISEEPTGFNVRARISEGAEFDLDVCSLEFTYKITNPGVVEGVVVAALTAYGLCVGFQTFWSLKDLADEADEESKRQQHPNVLKRIRTSFSIFCSKHARMREKAKKHAIDCIKKVLKKPPRLPGGGDKRLELPAPDDGQEDDQT